MLTRVTTVCRRHIIKMVLQHSWLKQIWKRYKMRFFICALPRNCQTQADIGKPKILFKEELLQQTPGEQHCFGWGRHTICNGKTQPLIFIYISQTWIIHDVNFWRRLLIVELPSGLMPLFPLHHVPKMARDPTQNWDHISSARYNQNVLFLEVSVRPVAVRSPLPAIFQCHLWTVSSTNKSILL